VGPPQHAGQIQAESVYAQLARPVPQRVGDQTDHGERPGVKGVAAAGEVALKVVGGRVQPPVCQGGPVRATLTGVVRHHIDDHLKACGMQRSHHRAEFRHLIAGHCGVSGMYR
jgi:hypothetical protein